MPLAHQLTLTPKGELEKMKLDLAAAKEEFRTLKISYAIRGSELLKTKAKSQHLTKRITNQRDYIRELHTARSVLEMEGKAKDALIAIANTSLEKMNGMEAANKEISMLFAHLTLEYGIPNPLGVQEDAEREEVLQGDRLVYVSADRLMYLERPPLSRPSIEVD